jgi:hypothetical protein
MRPGSPWPAVWLLAFATFGAGCRPGIPQHRLVVEAGGVDRVASVVAFDWEDALDRVDWVAVDPEGHGQAVQKHGDEGWIVVDSLPAGATATYVLRPGSVDSGIIAVEDIGGPVVFSDGAGEVLRYQSRPTPLPDPAFDSVYVRGGYIYPLYTPSGALVVDDYPPNHIHHHGIWSAWTNVVFEGRETDFWNVIEKQGTVEPVALDTVWSGPVFGGLRARHRYVDLTSGDRQPAVAETWEVRVYNVGASYRLVELRVRHTAATDSAVILPEYLYGGLGFRGHRQWNGADSTFFLTSEGRTRADGHGTRARWSHVGGWVEGRLAGVGMLAHPTNFRAPEPMRIHPTEPFFCWAPSQLGEWRLAPDAPYEAAYRFVVSDGPPDAALLDRLWRDWAEPAGAKLTP